MTDGAGRGDTDYGRIFHPRRVAVAGVSTEGVFSYGGSLVLSLQAMGYEGRIFPVNPKGGNFSGLKIFRRIEDIPGDIDLAVIAVGAAAVPKTLEACRKKGPPVRRSSLPGSAKQGPRRAGPWKRKSGK